MSENETNDLVAELKAVFGEDAVIEGDIFDPDFDPELDICFTSEKPYPGVHIEDIVKAQEAGLTVFNFTPAYGRILTLDLDNGWREGFPNPAWDFVETTSKNGRKHAYLYGSFKYIRELAVDFGSDVTREKAADDEHNGLDPYAYLMFETQEEAAKLREWLKTLPEDVQALVEEL